MRKGLMAGAALLATLAVPAAAELAISGNDNKMVLRDGVVTTPRDPAPDTLTVLDLAASPPRVVAEVAVPHSVVGPPFGVAITPDERLALVSSNQWADPAHPGGLVPDTRVSVVDLAATPPRVAATLQVGAGPAGISINRAGTLALVANRADGSVSVIRIRDGAAGVIGRVEIGPVGSEVSHVTFTPDGRHALVTRYGDNTINVLTVDGETVTKTDREITTGVRPYGIVVAPDGHAAFVANIGRGTGDADTVSVLDLTREPWRIVDTISVGQTPEGIAISPDGAHLAVTVMNGSNKPAASPFHGTGLVRLFRVDGTHLVPVAEATVGTWSQGAAFSADSRRLLVQNMVERQIMVLRVEGDALRDTGERIAVGGGPAAIRVAERPS